MQDNETVCAALEPDADSIKWGDNLSSACINWTWTLAEVRRGGEIKLGANLSFMRSEICIHHPIRR